MTYVCWYLFLRFKVGRNIHHLNRRQTPLNLQQSQLQATTITKYKYSEI